jgi:hypothetical protein
MPDREIQYPVELVRVECPAAVKAGQAFDLAVEFIPKDAMPGFTRLCVHFHRSGFPSFEADPHKVNADCWCRSSEGWTPGKSVRIASIAPTLLAAQPPGEYVLSLFLVRSEKAADGTTITHRGVFTNPEIGADGAVATLRVTS